MTIKKTAQVWAEKHAANNLERKILYWLYIPLQLLFYAFIISLMVIMVAIIFEMYQFFKTSYLVYWIDTYLKPKITTSVFIIFIIFFYIISNIISLKDDVNSIKSQISSIEIKLDIIEKILKAIAYENNLDPDNIDEYLERVEHIEHLWENLEDKKDGNKTL